MQEVIHHRINLPLSFCEFAIRNRFQAPLRLYLYLKVRSHGQLRMDAKERKAIAENLGIDPKTVSNLLEKLRRRNWVGHNPASGIYFVRGFGKVREIEGFLGLQAVRLDVHRDLAQQEIFKALTAGAFIGNLARISKYRSMKEQASQGPERLKRRSNHRSRGAVPSHFPVACKALSALLGIASSTASEFKALAAKHGFIQVQKPMRRLPLAGNPGQSDAHLVAAYKAACPEKAHRVRILQGKAYLQQADHVAPCMSYCRHRRPAPQMKARV